MCNKSDEQLAQVLYGVLGRLGEVEEQLKEIQKLKELQAFIIKKAVDDDRKLRTERKAKRNK